MKLRSIAMFGVLAVCAASASANLIVNGSFEIPDQFGGWGLSLSIPGWTAVSGQIETGDANVYGVSNQDLAHVLECDSTENSIVEQMVGTTASANYLLTFGVAQRVNVDPSSCVIEVWWDGALLDSITPTSTVMAYYGYNVMASSANTSLQFRGAGTEDSLGGLVDKVELVPEPASIAILGMGVLALARRKR